MATEPENIMGEILEKCDSLSLQTQKKTDPIPPELMAMPEDVLIIILEKCDFISIQRLRSTCRAFQNFIDRKKPSYHFKYITINGSQKEIFLAFSEENEFEEWYPNGQKIIMVYKKIDEESTKIDWMRDDGERIKIIGNSNFMDLFCRDLGHILDRNTTNFNLLSIDSQNYRFYVNIQKVLESSGKTPLKVHTLAIENNMCQENVLEILRYICLDTIERLEIHCPECRWDISKIVKSDHWKNAKELEMSGLPVRAGIQNYEHFEDANFCLEEGTVDDVISVKENFLNSPSTTKHFEIMFENFPDEERLIESFGQPYREPDDFQPAEQKSWFFRRPDDHVLFLTVESHRAHRVLLNCIIKTLADVPEGARVIG